MKRCKNETCAVRFEIVEELLCPDCYRNAIFVDALKWARDDIQTTKHLFAMGGQGPCHCDRCEEAQKLANQIQAEIDRRS